MNNDMKDLKQEQEWESKRDSTRVKERAKVWERDRERCTETHRERETRRMVANCWQIIVQESVTYWYLKSTNRNT